jgi:hypothetical protein
MPAIRQREIYRDGQLIGTVPYEVSDIELEREQRPAALRDAYTRERQIATQADTLAAQASNVTQAQIKALAAAVADQARHLAALIREEARERYATEIQE